MIEAAMQALQRIEVGQQRIEGKLDLLLGALAEEDEPQLQPSLDGPSAARERDQSSSLDNSSDNGG
jgi:hypothetical protein